MWFSSVVRFSSRSAVALAFFGIALGHGDLHERIQDITIKIESGRGTADLYLKRGELYRLHRDWEKALSDFTEAERLSADLPHFAYLKGRLWLERGDPEKAVPYLDAFLEKNPRHVDARLLRSRAMGKVGRLRAAVSDLDIAIGLHARATPEYFLERAHLHSRLGDLQGALSGLDEGLELLGPIVSLANFAIDLEVKAGRYEPALARLDALPPLLSEQPAWIARKAGILVQAGRLGEAVREYELALQAIANLPPHRAQTRASVELRAQIRQRLAALAARGVGAGLVPARSNGRPPGVAPTFVGAGSPLRSCLPLVSLE